MADTNLNEWNEADLKHSGFNKQGKRNPKVLKEAGKPRFLPSPQFADWLAGTGGSLIFSTYQTGRLFFLGIRANGSLYVQERTVGTAMGLFADADKLWVGCRNQLWRFVNTGAAHLEGHDYDAVYLPRVGYMIGQSNTHDVVGDVYFQGQFYEFLFANTQYSCISAFDNHYCFKPLWKPDFITALTPEDRCHLNGICAKDGELAFATVCGRFDTPLGWKAQQTGGAFIIDLRSGEIVCTGLSMPHSPRWHNGHLWLLNSGEGELGYVDFSSKQFVPVANCAGFARGLTFVGNYAVVGLSRLRIKAEGILPNINLAQRLDERKTFQRCGLQIFDLSTGKLEHWLHIDGIVTELYDVIHLKGIARPYTPGFTDANQQLGQTHFPTI